MKLKKTSNGKPSLKHFKSQQTSTPQVEEKPKKRRDDIREVVDYTRPFNIFYSGVEDQNNFKILYDMGIRNFLMSYHYIQNKHLDTKVYEDKGVKFFIDSGAYTYMQDLKYQDATIEDWEKHIHRYLNWARKHKDMIFAIANLDLELMVGVDVVQEWNEKYFEPFMLETNIPVCFIWHSGDVDADRRWERYCQRYPYVGMSWVSDNTGDALDFNFGQSMLRVAEKYNTVVHGMGMTRTSLLTKLSFYTSDSTTWLVGLQYGEINFWNGQKMQRLKKDKWKTSYLDVICSKFGLDPNLLEEENVEEMIRANVGAFIEAEEFIQHMAKSRFYWMKPKTQKRTEADLDSIEYPSVEWLMLGHGNRPDVEKYARAFNISYEMPEEAENLVCDMTSFMNWDNPEYSDYLWNTYTPEILKEIHDCYVNRIVQNDEERIEDLREFYKKNLLGEDTTLLYLGTNFDRMVKERDEKDYITDEEYDYEDVSEAEINGIAMKYLPAPKEGDVAPEISELDDEIFSEAGIIPVRDENGKFLKGQRAVARPKKLFSEKYPKLACDMCVNAQRCPEYKAGYVCAYNKMFSRYNTRDMADVIQAMQGIVDLSMQRLQRSMMTEVLNGGLPDPNVSQMMNQSMQLLTQLQRMYESGSQEVIRQTKILRADGTQEMTTQVSNPQSGGILAQIFGNMGASSLPDEDEILAEEPKEVIDVTPKEEPKTEEQED